MTQILPEKHIQQQAGDLGTATGTGQQWLQFINECVNKKELSKNQLGCFVDYGWEGVNLFMFKKLSTKSAAE